MNPSNRTLSMMSPKVKRSVIALGMLSALTLHGGEYLRIGEQWKSSSEYQEYLQKGGDNTPEGIAIKEKTIIRLTDEAIQQFIVRFDKKYQDRMAKSIDELPIGLKGLLMDIHGSIIPKLSKSHDAMSLMRIQKFELNFVESIYTGNDVAKRSIDSIVQIAPELDKTEIISYLRELGRKYDDAAKASADAAKWQEVIDILKKLQ